MFNLIAEKNSLSQIDWNFIEFRANFMCGFRLSMKKITIVQKNIVCEK